MVLCKQCGSVTANKKYCNRECYFLHQATGATNSYFGNKFTLERKEIARNRILDRKKKYGYIQSEESRKKISESKKGKISFRKGISNIEEYGKEKAKLLKEKMRISQLGKKHTKETKQKMSDARKGYVHSKITKNKIGKGNKGKKLTEKTKHLLCSAMYKRMSEGKYVNCDTDIERLVENQLLFNNVLYIKQHNYGIGVADFWLPESNTIIECDGSYWHSLPGRKKLDNKKDEYLENNDYIILRLSDIEIKNNLMGCLKSIM